LAADTSQIEIVARPKPRVVKAAEVRRAELIDCAQSLFLSRGYERTTINDVIAATGLSKGAFYHHFRSKEDLLEAIAARFASQALERAAQDNEGLDALGQLNQLLAMAREWKGAHMPELRAVFTTLLTPENAVLYHRIVGAVFEAMAPKLVAVIERGARGGIFDAANAEVAAETMLWLGEGRRAVVVRALELCDSGAFEAGARVIIERLRAEESMIDRILGLSPGSISLAGSDDYIRTMLRAWTGRATVVATD
jgi:AcrR family transcriptional regulator